MTDAYLAPATSHRYVLELVREADRDRFLGALFAPDPGRRDILALLAFDLELARTRSVTREPLLARIRLEWWREAVAEAAGEGKPRAQPIVESLSEMLRRRQDLSPDGLLDLVATREEEIDTPFDAPRAGRALADCELAVLGIDDEASRRAARAVATARLTEAGPKRDALIAEARALRRDVDPRALPILLPALSLGDMSPWRKPLAYWWAARRGRY